MPELNDREMDELFQAGSERHDFEYKPEAWAQMETLLDAERGGAAGRWRKPGVLIALALALALLTWLLFPAKPNASAPATNDFNRPASAEQMPGPMASDEAALSPASSLQAPAAKSKSSGSGPNEGRTPQTLTVVPSAPAAVTKRPKILFSQSNDTEDQAIPTNVANPRGEELASAEVQAPNPVPAGVAQLPSAGVVEVSYTPSHDFKATLPPTRVSTFERTEQANGLTVTASGGAILGQAGSDAFDELRPRFGLEAEYRLGRKFAFGAGAFYNTVCYLTKEENYNPKEGFWSPNQGVTPEMVRGECRVLEVPLSVKYYLNGSANNGVYLATGATTYVLLREHYNYFYAENNPNLKQKWTEEMTNRHYLGMGHFNLGYQHKLNRKHALKVEGFVQLPLTGIGHGDVRLFTTGLSLNYQFDLRR